MALLTTACSDKFGDDLRSLGGRVEVLEQRVLEMNTDLESLQTMILTIQQNGYITSVTRNQDGTTTITFNDGHSVTLRDGRTGQDGADGQDGQDGQEATLLMGIRQASDGMWYWTLNGQWLLDSDGNKVRAGATDGKDGEDGQDGLNGRDGHDGRDGQDGIVPQMRINDEGFWEVSTDGGLTWQNTGVQANGKDGEPGRADIFGSVELSEDGTYLIVHLADGSEPFHLPIM